MARLAGTTGSVYAALQVLEDCEDAWNEQVVANVTASVATGDSKVGSGSALFTVAAGFATGVIGSEAISTLNLSAYNQIMAWVKSSVALDASDYSILLDNTANCASPIITANIPALVVDTWKYIKIAADLSGCTGIVSVGLRQNVDKGLMLFQIDQLAVAKEVAGMKEWTLDIHFDALDSTGFDSAGVRSFVPAVKDWKGRFSGFKDGAPFAIGDIIGLELRESSTTTQQYRGIAVITDYSVETTYDGLVAYSYAFQGVHDLEIATA